MKIRWFRLALSLILTFIAPIAAFSQTFSILDVDASGFPVIRVKFTARDEAGNSIRNFLSSDFTVKENGATVTLSSPPMCPPLKPREPLSILLVNDKSLSMAQATIDGLGSRMDLLKQGATALVQSIDFSNGQTAVGLTAFDQKSYIIRPFTNDVNSLLSGINSLTTAGGVGTEYNEAFLAPVTGGATPGAGGIEFLKTRPANIRRIMIFLTDGQPTTKPWTDSIIVAAKKEKIEVYSITVDMDMNLELKRISMETGGMSFPNLRTQTEAKAIYRLIGETIQGQEPCQLEWVAPWGCTEASRVRPLEITYKPMSTKKYTGEYTAPPNSVGQLLQDVSIIGFGDPAVGLFTDKQITITAKNAPFRVSGAIFTPTNPYFAVQNWGGSAPPFTLNAGESRVITVRFTQIGSQDYRLATLSFSATPCTPKNITIWGGAPPFDQTPIQIVSPNGGEVFASCDTVDIQWVGVAPERPIVLSYSDNNGATWKIISSAAVGLHYVWNPPSLGKNYLIRAEALANPAVWQWAYGAGGVNDDVSYAIGIDGLDNIYTAGENKATSQFNYSGGLSNTLTGSGGFVAQYTNAGDNAIPKRVGMIAKMLAVDPNGNYYISNGRSFQRYNNLGIALTAVITRPDVIDTIRGISTDALGNLYMVGYKTLASSGTDSLFVAKYSTTGTKVWEKKQIDANGICITADASGTIAISGSYDKSINSFCGSSQILTGTGKYIAKLDQNGTVLWVKTTAPVTTMGLAFDQNGALYQTGWYTGQPTFGTNAANKLQSFGFQDAFLARYTIAGDVAWARGAGSSGNDQSAGVTTDIYGKCYITGFIQDQATIGSGIFPSVGGSDAFVAKFDSLGANDWVLTAGGLADDIPVGITVDRKGHAIISGYSKSPLAFGANQVGNAGAKDVFVAKITNVPGGIDASDNIFAIDAPTLTRAQTTLNGGSIALGQSVDTPFPSLLCNKGTLPFLITKAIFKGANPQDFELVSPLDGVTIDTGKCANVEIRFRPSAVEKRTALLILESRCSFDTLFVEGTGISPCGGKSQSIFTIGVSQISVPLSKTLTAAIVNTNSAPLKLTISVQGPDKALFKITSPTNITLNNLNDSYDLTVEFTPTAPGKANAYIDYGLETQCGAATTTLDATGKPTNPFIQASTLFAGAISCPNVSRDTALRIQNIGGSDLTITSAGFDSNTEGFSILSTFPKTILSGFSDTLTVRFAPKGAPGAKSATVRLTGNADNAPFTVQLTGTRDSLGLESAPLNFGALAPSDFASAVKNIAIKNTGTLSLSLSAWAATPGKPFVVVSGIPVTLTPGQSANVGIRFNDPLTDGSYQDDIVLTSTPQCVPFILKVSGNRGGASAVISLPDIAADPHTKAFHIPISYSAQNAALAASKSFTVTLRFNGSLFLPYDLSNKNNAKLTVKRLANGDRLATITADRPERDGLLTDLIGDVLLGDAEFTAISVEPDLNWLDVSATANIGKLTLLGICKEGSTRLLKQNSTGFGIQTVAPNPAGDRAVIAAFTIEKGLHSVSVLDINGRVVYSEEWLASEAGEHLVEIPAGKLPSGVYSVLLQSPAKSARETLLIAR